MLIVPAQATNTSACLTPATLGCTAVTTSMSAAINGPVTLFASDAARDRYHPPLSGRRSRTDGEFTIGFVVRLSPEKNVRLLAEPEQALHAAGVLDCRFLIVGDGSEREWLMKNMKRAVVPGILRGAPLHEAYANMDVFVFPSVTDTFGNVVLESMASGVPPIVTASGGPRNLIQPGVNGYIADSTAKSSAPFNCA